jgi:hypothetical protein
MFWLSTTQDAKGWSKALNDQVSGGGLTSAEEAILFHFFQIETT